MRIADTIYLSVENFKNRKSRTFMTILGVGVGIGAVLFLVSLGYGLQKLLLERITTAESLLTLDIAAEARVIVLDDETVERIRAIPFVEKVSPQAVVTSQANMRGLNAEIVLNLVDADFLSLDGALPQIGRLLTSSDQNKIVVTSRTAELFNLTPDELLGQNLRLTILPSRDDEGAADNITQPISINRGFEIVGVVEDIDGPGQIYALAKDIPEITNLRYQNAKIKVDADRNLETVRGQLIEMGFTVSAITDVVEQANRIFRVVQIVLGIFGVVAVVVAAISLANTMTISLLERTQDIGIMRAIGASRRDIRNLFLIESTLIGLAGGVLGILIGFLGAFLFNSGLALLARILGGQPVGVFYTPPWFIGFIIIFSTSVGLATGVFPARRAARLNPLQALRYK